MSSPKQVSVQSRNPRRSLSKRDPGRHYVLVEDEQVDAYLDLAGISNPEQDRYKEESRDRKETGRKGLVLLSCSQEDYVALMAENSITARGEESRPNDSRAPDDAHGVTSVVLSAH